MKVSRFSFPLFWLFRCGVLRQFRSVKSWGTLAILMGGLFPFFPVSIGIFCQKLWFLFGGLVAITALGFSIWLGLNQGILRCSRAEVEFLISKPVRFQSLLMLKGVGPLSMFGIFSIAFLLGARGEFWEAVSLSGRVFLYLFTILAAGLLGQAISHSVDIKVVKGLQYVVVLGLLLLLGSFLSTVIFKLIRQEALYLSSLTLLRLLMAPIQTIDFVLVPATWNEHLKSFGVLFFVDALLGIGLLISAPLLFRTSFERRTTKPKLGRIFRRRSQGWLVSVPLLVGYFCLMAFLLRTHGRLGDATRDIYSFLYWSEILMLMLSIFPSFYDCREAIYRKPDWWFLPWSRVRWVKEDIRGSLMEIVIFGQVAFWGSCVLSAYFTHVSFPPLKLFLFSITLVMAALSIMVLNAAIQLVVWLWVTGSRTSKHESILATLALIFMATAVGWIAYKLHQENAVTLSMRYLFLYTSTFWVSLGVIALVTIRFTPWPFAKEGVTLSATV